MAECGDGVAAYHQGGELLFPDEIGNGSEETLHLGGGLSGQECPDSLGAESFFLEGLHFLCGDRGGVRVVEYLALEVAKGDLGVV